jgi:hypothetical protein
MLMAGLDMRDLWWTTGELKSFERELNNLYVSGPIARAVMENDKNFASSEAEAKQLLKAQERVVLNSNIINTLNS